MAEHGLSEDFYRHVGDDHTTADYSVRERLAIEYAERFALDHAGIDDEFIGRLRDQFTDAEILDLSICLAHFLGQGRLLKVLGIDQTCQLDV